MSYAKTRVVSVGGSTVPLVRRVVDERTVDYYSGLIDARMFRMRVRGDRRKWVVWMTTGAFSCRSIDGCGETLQAAVDDALRSTGG